ncbi:MAG: tRNA pseudouridine(55) synthase TruB [Ignavibacteriaceae bacterium]
MITRETTDFSVCNFDEGEIILTDKPFGWSSFKVVYKIRKATRTKKVGHAGTLDPKATGLLIVCTGKKTKEITKFQDMEKTYTGIILLGKTSPSMDLETEITEEKSLEGITEEQILNVRNEFLGTINQIPPMYSAIKFQGKSLYKLARKGKVVHREAREVNISKFNITKISLPEIHFEISCSKGTYIRVIADDFGRKLGCGGLLSSLRRTKIGQFSVKNAVSVEDFVEKILTGSSISIIS